MSTVRQCKLLEISRSTFNYRSSKGPEKKLEDEKIMQVIDRIYTDEPTFGSRRIRCALRDLGYNVCRQMVRRLMREMGIYAIYPKPRLSVSNQGHKKYPYLLRELKIERPNQVWCCDITYIPMGKSHVYLTAIMDWHSRYVISWRLSNTLDVSFCIEALEEAFGLEGVPEIFNTDQGCQFTSDSFTEKLLERKIKISMDGRGRALDNRMIERLWRSVKYDDVYLRCYENMTELRSGLTKYFNKYNIRAHQGLEECSPESVYRKNRGQPQAA